MVDITLGGAVRPAGEVGVSVNPPAGPLPLLVTPVSLWLTARLEGEQLTLTAHGATSYSGDLTAAGDWPYRWASTTPNGAEEGVLHVRTQRV